jgi:TP901 family phage tail tape measure protein
MSARLDSIARAGELAVQRLKDLDAMSDAAFGSTAASADGAAGALDSFERETAAAANAVGDLSNTGAAAERALEQERRAAGQAAEQLEAFGDTAEQAGERSEGFGSASAGAVQDLSRALAAAGIAKAIHEIYSAFAGAVGAAIEFESAITGVYKTVDGTTGQLSQISAEIKAMSTVMPSSATDIAAVAEAAGQLGIATDDVTGFAEVMINLGEATNLSADEAASSLAKFTNITGMAAKNYESLGSTVVALGNSFATTEADIVAMSTRMASAGTLAGLTEPEILALAAAMSSVGIEADAGGSAMSRLLTDIQVAVETGSGRLEEFASVAGMAGKEFAGVFGGSASEALFSFISGLNDVERNGATATVILENMGITEVRLSNAIKSLANDSEGLSGAIAVANSAWSANTALANEAGLRYGTLESRISMTENAADNLSAAIGDDLTPVVGAFVDAGRGALEWFAGIVEKYPAVSAGLAAVAVAVSIAAGAVTAFALVTSPMAVAAIGAITAAMTANPVFLIVTGVVALTAAAVAFAAILAGQKSEYDKWTASTKNQHDELQQLNAEYENAVEAYGATSEEALALRYEVDGLSAAFEASKKTVEQFVAECDKLVESHNQAVFGYAEAAEKLDYEAQGTLALVQKLEQLGSKTNATAAEQEQMKAIIERLNTVVPDLALNYSDVTESLDTTIASLQKMAQEQADQEKQAENYRAYVDLLKEQAALEEKLAEAEGNLTAERERRNMAYAGTIGQWANTVYPEDSPWVSWATDLDEYKDALNEVQAAYDENLALQERLEAEMGEYARQAEEAKAVSIAYGEAVSSALSGIQAEMDELAVAYDESYQAARDSIDGVIGLFDTMKTETELSVSDMTAALQSQTEYLAAYAENLRKAAEYGLDDGLIASLSDGSAESAGQLDAIIGKIEELGGATADAAGFVSSFNSQFAEVEKAKDEFAATVAEMETGFSAELDRMGQDLADAITEMDMETEAAAAAKDTMQAYIAEILASQTAAVTAAEAVANATAAALGRTPTAAGTATPASKEKKYAAGTESAERGLALVGEEGPELIGFSGGERVFTARETREIIDGSPVERSQAPVFYAPADDGGSGYLRAGARQQEASSQRKITLDITGSGEIDVSGADEETVWDIVAPRLKDAFMGIIRAEVFEEGDRSYAF